MTYEKQIARNVNLKRKSFSHASGKVDVIELSVVGRGKNAFLWIGTQDRGFIGDINNGAQLRRFFAQGLKRLHVTPRKRAK